MAAPLSALIPRLRSLLATGFVADANGALQVLRCLAHPVVEGAGNGAQNGEMKGWVISQRLLAVHPQLASNEELVSALLAQQSEVRATWLAIAAARCQEVGQMADPAPFLELVSSLHQAASWVEAALPSAALAASPFATLERELLGASFEQAAATPALIRILAVAAQLAQFDDALPALPMVDQSGSQAQRNWTKGRLLALPVTAAQKPPIADEMLLHGRFATETVDAPPAISWVLAHPWPLLLAMLVFAQDAWKAENRGGLLLELPAGQNAFSPSEIAITVVGSEGDEIRCGSLADLLLKTLASLGVACFPGTPSMAELNAQLSPLVGLLLSRQVWRFQDGASGQLGQYQIHSLFADESYRLPGSKVFNRTGKLLWQVVRVSAEALYQEHKLAYRREPAIRAENPVREGTYS
jgi:hypothetical protein